MVSGHGEHRLHGVHFIPREPTGGVGAYAYEIFCVRSIGRKYADGGLEI